MNQQKKDIDQKPRDISELAAAVGWQGRPDLLLQAVTHPAFYEGVKSEQNQDNQRLEFLGDAVLDFLIADTLYHKHPDADEGLLSRIRAAMVCEGALADIAKKLELSEYLRMGKGAIRKGEQYRESVISDAFEALVAAIYLEQGLDKVKAFIDRLFTPAFENLSLDRFEDCKGLMQQLVQSMGEEHLQYKLIDATGPDHNKTYTIALIYSGKKLAEGVGSSKKEAEQKAARTAWENREKWLKELK